ncbi:redox-sensing transcriptional repressor [Caldanaerobius fijiensis DSM 17918]|uniref:Redox-sensing transcriptional repressor Rex n=1 Tax=Caldanaerobius fijiensis DSM 17918 TaxID=1121256 RepID=A0A1M4VZ81_9THEO|nr:redox-sensing transcriptional repressor Rex [Caldanaerobius fijiensis]SHE74354.1 redox-sensing transcriptional repressor [Caldanaerobius fijiensis DSM 17918]
MAKETKISMAIIRRLPRYHRYLGELLNSGVTRISSQELSKKMGVTASQIRQDLNSFGGFGQQGYGYNVKDLYDAITKILGLEKTYNSIIVGAGNLGQAIANYTGFQSWGFKLKALFDVNPKLIGLKIRDVEILDVDLLEDFVSKNPIDIAILTIPKERAQEIVDRLVAKGVKAFWNFSAVDVNVPDDVIVESVHLSDSLFTISYRLNEDELFKKIKEK